MMEYINQKYNEDGTINCDINHPDYGWIPTTLSPDDPETSELFAILNAGTVASYTPPVKTQEELLKELEDVVQSYLNTIPIQENFLAPSNFTQYLGYPNEFRLKAEHVGAFFATVWGYSNTEKDKLIAGTRTMPTQDEYLLELPQYTPYQGV